jgi:hypothetical protein
MYRFTGQVERGTTFSMSVTVCDPTEFQVTEEEFSVCATRSAVSRPNLLIPLRFSGSIAGTWMIRIVSGTQLLASLPVEIKIREAALRGDKQ